MSPRMVKTPESTTIIRVSIQNKFIFIQQLKTMFGVAKTPRWAAQEILHEGIT